jgi:hypothetical protein
LAKTISGCTRHLTEIETSERVQEEFHIEQVLAQAQAGLAGQLRRWRVLPEVTAWQAQYASDCLRYDFLVLEGRSKLGKTQFAKSLAASHSAILEINCGACIEPDLRMFRHAQHKYILFDEIRPHVVLRQRKLFQAGPCLVDLGASATNRFGYRKCLYKTMLILSTNIWSEDLEDKDMSQGDRSWLQANSVLVRVDAPLWTPE